MRRRCSRLVPAVCCALACAVVSLLPGLARAAVPDGATGHYADPSVDGASGAWTGTTSVAAAGFPVGTVASTSSSLARAGGTAAFLGPDTPFGDRFGGSARLPYLTADSAAGKAPSTTTVRFAQATPASGWGFALGDVDADRVTIAATDAAGDPLTGAALGDALGWQSAFNYCAVTPKPSACTGLGPFIDRPTWDPGTATLTGSGTNTLGAAGWFTPTVALRSISFTFSVQAGTPNYQLWLAALSVPVTGTVDGTSDATPGVAVDLLDSDGKGVVGPDGDPVQAEVGDDGSFEFPAVVDGDYVLRVEPGPDARVAGNRTAEVRVRAEDGAVTVSPDTFAVTPIRSPGSSSPGTTSATTVVPGPVANTGVGAVPLIAGVVLLAVGIAVLGATRWSASRSGRRRG